jgi:hypothetical protein
MGTMTITVHLGDACPNLSARVAGCQGAST